MVYNIIMFKNLENFIIKNALPKHLIEEIYKSVKNAPKDSEHVVEVLGHTAYFIDFSNGFKNEILKIIQPHFDFELEVTELQFARYHHQSGYVPKLFPHFDGFKEHRITFDIQLDSNIDWPIIIENKEYLLKNNDALIFSGTDQIHWRSNYKLSKNDYTDMFFVHLSLKNNNIEISKEFKEDREQRLEYFKKIIQITSAAIESGE